MKKIICIFALLTVTIFASFQDIVFDYIEVNKKIEKKILEAKSDEDKKLWLGLYNNNLLLINAMKQEIIYDNIPANEEIEQEKQLKAHFENQEKLLLK
jgi:hypothetical protein